MKFAVAQLGARMDYAVPRILAQAGMLETFFTDFCVGEGWARLAALVPISVRPPGIKRLVGRRPRGIASAKVVSFNSFGLEYVRRLRRGRSPTKSAEVYLWAGREFCRRVLAKGLGGANGVYTFNSAALEILEQAKREGGVGIVEQTIAPKAIEIKLLRLEADQFAGWEDRPAEDGFVQEYIDRERAEWSVADRIICGSDFVRNSVARCGGPAGKCVVVPYGVERVCQNGVCHERAAEAGLPLRILTVGTVGLRKGAPYVLEAARQFGPRGQFRMVGKIEISSRAQALLAKHVELVGAVPRSDIGEHYRWADVLLLPSICEGSATAVYEAMAAGLPVICTSNAGSQVRDGVEGFIVPIRTVEPIVERLALLVESADLRARLAVNAAKRAAEFTVERYGARLIEVLRRPI